MSATDRQNRLLVSEDWKRIYQSFRNADFQSYDFDNLRRTMINYLRQNYPEDFNDYIESSEYLALIDMIAFLGQNLSFRIDLNARENFLETAERRESVLRLARLLSYQVKRNRPSNGLLKVESVATTENIIDSSGINLASTTVRWNDISNTAWFEQFTKIMNAAFVRTNQIGDPIKRDNINGIITEKYKVNGLSTGLPVFKFTRQIDGKSTKFEVVNADINNGDIVEEPPLPGNSPSILYRDSGQGPGSSTTGFFMHFRQGTLNNNRFSITSPVPNQIINIDDININNSDVWLYALDGNGYEQKLWTKLDAVEGNNIIYNSLQKGLRDVYAVTTRVDDRINIVFSDGTFGNLPSGNFKIYYRTSANNNVTIPPNNMQTIQIKIPYVSKANKPEELTITMSLKYTVTNGAASESNNSVKTNAPSTYYTQNRLITAEDYNIGPLGVSQDIIKTRSINRLTSGISRYFELRDVTGKYSNTNLYANDGIIYKEYFQEKEYFDFATQSDVEGVILNTIEPLLGSTNIANFYFSEYTKRIVSDLNATWNQNSQSTNLSTGYFTDIDGVPYLTGTFTGNSLSLIEIGTLCKFIAPEGYHFMEDGSLMLGEPDHLGSTSYKWTKVVSVRGDGTTVENGLGPIAFNDVIPNGSILSEIRPKLANTLLDDIKVQIIDQIFNFNDFGLRYDDNLRQWRIITEQNLNVVNNFSTGKAGDNSGQQLDSSWLLYFKTNGETYTISYRNLRYIFESEKEIRFYYDDSDKIFNPATGKVIKDKIDVLSINRKPDSLQPFTQNYTWSITDEYRDSENYIDTRKIQVTFYDSDDDGVFDNPELFLDIVDENTNAFDKIIFQKKTIAADGVEEFRYFSNSDLTIRILENQSAIGAYSQYEDGQIFYLVEEEIFLVLNRANNNLSVIDDYKAFIGRGGLKFHYVHVADSNTRIDPAVSNIIDTYLLTKNYDIQTRLYLDGEISSKPLPPSSDELFRTYGKELSKIKSISDEIIYHPVKYKIIFGNKADPDLQVKFKIVKNPERVLNDNEIKSKVIEAINIFFSLENWDFGDTFYFQELATYVMNYLSPDILSIVIVPEKADLFFGSLFEVKSKSDEIFISGARVSDVEIIDSLTETKLRASGNVVTSNNTTNVTSEITSRTSSTTVGGYDY